MDKLVAKYATSKVTFDQSSFHDDSVHNWDAALQFAQPTFDIPMVSNPADFLRAHTDASAEHRIRIQHGTTTLAFKFQGGIIVAVDSRASMGTQVASQTVKKVIEINPYLLGTVAGGAADCQYWERELGRRARLHELRNHERISVAAASKMLSNMIYDYKGMDLSMGTMITGWDKTGPALYYVDSDGTRMKGDRFAVGSGSTFAYGVLDTGFRFEMSVPEALELGKRAIYHATFRDAYSGGAAHLYHVRNEGWAFCGEYDVNQLHWHYKSEPKEAIA
ncbi:Proteasome subunit beta type-5 [Podila minutissima]|nr:Proteasome subunit beta type-5 [Podila minutissima]